MVSSLVKFCRASKPVEQNQSKPIPKKQNQSWLEKLPVACLQEIIGIHGEFNLSCVNRNFRNIYNSPACIKVFERTFLNYGYNLKFKSWNEYRKRWRRLDQAGQDLGVIPDYDMIRRNQVAMLEKSASFPTSLKYIQTSSNILRKKVASFYPEGGKELLKYPNQIFTQNEYQLLSKWLKDANLLRMCREIPKVQEALEELKDASQEIRAEAARKMLGDPGINNLTELNLEHLRLTEISPEIKQFQQLKNLNLSYNDINALIPELGQLKMLEHLRLAYNQIEELIPELGLLENLKYLSFNGNRIKMLIPEICRLKNLITLDLDGNQIEVLIPEIGQLQQLEKFSLWKNKIRVLIPEIAHLKQLKNLCLEENPLQTFIPELKHMKNIIELTFTPFARRRALTRIVISGIFAFAIAGLAALYARFR